MALVRVYDGRRKAYRYRKALKAMGFRFASEPAAHWWNEVSEDRVRELEEWCFERRLEIETPYTRRSTDYRKAFFGAFEPNLGKDRYLCVYCGLPVRKEKITVDHLIAVKRAQRSRVYLGLLRRWGCESVNDVRNLVPSCRRCNSRKGTKAGSWVVRGLLGRKKAFWVTVWCFYALAAAAGLGALWLP